MFISLVASTTTQSKKKKKTRSRERNTSSSIDGRKKKRTGEKKTTILRLIHLQCRSHGQSNRKTDTWVSVKREIVLSYLIHYLRDGCCYFIFSFHFHIFLIHRHSFHLLPFIVESDAVKFVRSKTLIVTLFSRSLCLSRLLAFPSYELYFLHRSLAKLSDYDMPKLYARKEKKKKTYILYTINYVWKMLLREIGKKKSEEEKNNLNIIINKRLNIQTDWNAFV